MKPKLFFGIDIPFNPTINETLREESALRFWDKGMCKYVYIFGIEKLDKVIRIWGREIDFDDEKLHILNLLQHAPALKQEVDVDRWKGTGFLLIERFPKLFIVKTVIEGSGVQDTFGYSTGYLERHTQM